MKTFDSPGGGKCIVCGTSKDEKCILVPIDGTGDGKICEAALVHINCIDLRMNSTHKIMYQTVEEHKDQK